MSAGNWLQASFFSSSVNSRKIPTTRKSSATTTGSTVAGSCRIAFLRAATLLTGQAESVERPRELPGELAKGRLLGPAAARLSTGRPARH